LAFEKHGQLAGNLIIVGQEDGTGRADELCGRIEEIEHGRQNGDKRAQESNKIWRLMETKTAKSETIFR
jgi:hypothetical protein